MGLAEPDRTEVIAWGVAECGIVLLLFLSVCFNQLAAEKMFRLRTRSDKILFLFLAIWFGACCVGAVVGVAHDNPLDYLLGDYYRFASLPFIFAALYFALKESADIQRLLRGFVAIYGAMVALDLFRFNAFLVEEQERLTTETAHQAGLIAVAVIYLMLFDPDRRVRRASAVVLLLTTVLLFRAQMLTPLLTSLLAMALFFIFSRKFAVFLGAGIAVIVLVVASFYSSSVAPAVPSYIADKFLTAEDSVGPLESVEALSGVRLGEIISIGGEFVTHPASLAIGTGEGSLISPDPISTPTIAFLRYTQDKHYVHAGLFDALYHNGIIAVAALLLLLFHLSRRARQLRSNGIPFGLFVIITILVTLLLLCYDLPFESAIPLLALCFSGISIMESAPRQLTDGFRMQHGRQH